MKSRNVRILAMVVSLAVAPWSSELVLASEFVHTADTLSEARIFLSATTVNSKAMFAGGNRGAIGISDVVDIYDSYTYTWSTATLSEHKMDLAAFFLVIPSQI